MELLGILFVLLMGWFLLKVGKLFLSAPLTFIFAMIGLGFLFGDDDCDL